MNSETYAVKHHRDINFTVVAKPASHHVNYEVYQIIGWDENDHPLWHRADANALADTVESLEQSEIYLSGSVKWDGCSNWRFDEQYRVMLHGCSRGDLLALGEIMARCWDWTKDLLPTWDSFVADDGPKNPSD